MDQRVLRGVGDVGRERVDEAVELAVRQRPVDESVPLGGRAVEGLRAEDDLERPGPPDQRGQPGDGAAAGDEAGVDFGLVDRRQLDAGEPEIARRARTRCRPRASLPG